MKTREGLGTTLGILLALELIHPPSHTETYIRQSQPHRDTEIPMPESVNMNFGEALNYTATAAAPLAIPFDSTSTTIPNFKLK
jgi:hypothetical protein